MALYAISQQHPYAYAAAAPPPPARSPPRHCSNHGTSSAFSSSAHPDEDWTKISDLAERRRIQNRIAQRNYRKKLKRRLEDLERRAGSEEGDAAAVAPAEKKPALSTQPSSPSNKVTKRQPSTKSHKAAVQQTQAPLRNPKPVKAIVSQGQFTPPMDSHEELAFGGHSSSYDDRERSHTPPVFSYTTTYPAPDELLINPYGPAHSHPVMTTAEAYPSYMAATAMPTALPPLSHYNEPPKRDLYPDNIMNPYIGYGFVPGPDMSMPGHYDPSNPLTPPLSLSYEHSATGSEPGYDYPSTPLSMPGSPAMMQRPPHHHH